MANLPAGMGLTIDDGKTLQIGPPPRVGPKLDIAPGTYFVSMIDANGVGVGDSTAIEIPASRWFDDGEIVCRSNVGGVARLTCVVHTGSRTHGSTLHDGVYEITPDAGDATGAAEVAFTADGAANVELRQGASQVLNAPPGDATRHDLPAGDFLAGISFVGEITVTTVVHVPRDARFELASLACRRASAFTAVCSLTSADRALAAVPIDGVVKLCR